MNIAIDLSQITTERAGIEYYTHELVKALLRIDKENTYFLVSNNVRFLDYPNAGNVKKIILKAEKPNLLWFIRLAFYCYLNKIDSLISPSNFFLSVLFRRTIQIVHDVAPVVHSEFWPKNVSKKFESQLKLALKYAKEIVTVSNATKNELTKLYPKFSSKYKYLGYGINEWVLNSSDMKGKNIVRSKFGLTENYLLSVATIQPRKNYINMIKAFAIFLKDHPDYSYAISGKKGWYYEEIFNIAKELGVDDRVKFLGYVDEKDFPELYDNAKAMLFCSIHEGIGLPPLEAICRDIPVVVSDIEVFREVLGDNAFYCNPMDPNDISAKLTTAIESKVNSSNIEKIKKEFTWENTAKKLISIIQKS